MTQEEIRKLERIIAQLRGYFQTEKDILFKTNALRMLDDIEIIIKRCLEK